MTEHLGRDKHEMSEDRRNANTRNDTTVKTVTVEAAVSITI